MKDLILIASYTPDSERVKYLRDLLNTIHRDRFDIMISSHSSIPEDLIQDSDYFIFQKRNTLLTDFDHKFAYWFENESFCISSTEFKTFNHLIAAGSLMLNGLASAKEFGYEKVHFIEYDSLILDDSEFFINSKLLENHSVIWYEHADLKTAFPLMSVNLKKLNLNWFDLSEKFFYSFLEDSLDKTLEYFNMKLINLESQKIKREFSRLSGKIETQRYTTDEEDWITVVAEDNKFILFNFNYTGINEVNVFLNDNEVKTLLNTNRGTWMTISLGNIDEINKMKIYLNDEIIRSYDFNIVDKQKYVKTNWLKNKNI
jgi:hypothetical protein